MKMGHLSPLLVVFVAFCTLNENKAENPIDSYIYGLSYSNDKILAYKGDQQTSAPVKRKGRLQPNKDFMVTIREKKTLQNGFSDIAVVTSNEHVSYPGALLLANRKLTDNFPDIIAVPRAPLTYTVNLPGLTKKGHFTIVPSFSEYQSAKERALISWFTVHADDSVAANFQSEYTFAYSREYLRVKFGLDFKSSLIESSIDFSAMKKNKKLIMIHRFKQVFYTVSVEAVMKPSDLFAPSVTVKELKQRTSENNPPVMVDSVSYGRIIYVKLETSSTDSEAKSTLETQVTSFDIKGDIAANISKQLKNLNMQVFVVGGSVKEIQLLKVQSFQDVNEILVRFARFSQTNVGYPISYSANFIKDNTRAIVKMYTDYIETTTNLYTKGVIQIIHKGWFVMHWIITWKEVIYTKKGVESTKKVSWKMNCQDLTAPFQHEIELPGNAQEIHVIGKVATGLPWEFWRTIIDKSGIPLINKRTFKVWGTTLYAKSSIVPPV